MKHNIQLDTILCVMKVMFLLCNQYRNNNRSTRNHYFITDLLKNDKKNVKILILSIKSEVKLKKSHFLSTAQSLNSLIV